MKTAEDIALLASVPLIYLEDGAKMKGRVAFGSRSYELFLKLEELRGNDDVDVYIYASHSGGRHDAKVSWHARYVGFVRSDSGIHTNPKHRPPSTMTDTPDSAVFWEVEDLKRLEPPIRIGELRGVDKRSGNKIIKKKPYVHTFRPRGPVLIEHP
jgi:hypothetical protein